MVCRCAGAFLALVICCLVATPAVSANCEAVIRLAQLYDAFYAITRETGDIRTRAAARLYPQLATLDVEEFAKELDAGFSEEKVAEALTTARILSREIIMDADLSPFRVLDSRDEAEFLAEFIERSRCLAGASGGNGGGSTSSDPENDDSGEKKLTFGPKSGSQGAKSLVDTSKPATMAILIGAGILALGASGFFAIRSRRMKIHMAERLPRHRIRLDFTAAYAGASGAAGSHSVTALDVSLGGMKLKVPEPLDNGTQMELSLPIGPVSATVIWSNAHYAGILFDERLEGTALSEILKIA